MDYSYDYSTTLTDPTALWALMGVYVWIVVVIGLLSWVYLALAYSAIGRKAGDSMPALAWIPAVGPALIAFRAAKMHWWPWLLLIVFWVPVLGQIAVLAFAVYSIIWTWKMFEKISRPGWWAILILIPLLNYIMPGIAAWSEAKK